jgi:hypothetical protein
MKKEQLDRFIVVLRAKGKYCVECDNCPIKTQCFEASEKLNIEEAQNQVTCEEVLCEYVLTGEVRLV